MDTEKALEIIRTWMNEQGVNQLQLSKKTGYSAGLVSLIFRGLRNASVEFLGDSAEALGHKKSELFQLVKYIEPPKNMTAKAIILSEIIRHLEDDDVQELIDMAQIRQKRKRGHGQTKTSTNFS